MKDQDIDLVRRMNKVVSKRLKGKIEAQKADSALAEIGRELQERIIGTDDEEVALQSILAVTQQLVRLTPEQRQRFEELLADGGGEEIRRILETGTE
jgi:hypothetical protein